MVKEEVQVGLTTTFIALLRTRRRRLHFFSPLLFTRLPFLSRRNHAKVKSKISVLNGTPKVQKGKTRGRVKRPTDLRSWKRMSQRFVLAIGLVSSFSPRPLRYGHSIGVTESTLFVFIPFLFGFCPRWTTQFIRIFSTIKFVSDRNTFLRSIFFTSFFYCASLWIILDNSILSGWTPRQARGLIDSKAPG